MKLLKLILTDIAGVTLIILSILTGWIPGPGGIPLFLGGLGLLAIHHSWARKLLLGIKKNGLKLAERFFVEHRVVMALYDVVALLLFAAGTYILIDINGVFKTSAILCFVLGLSLFLGNRKRLQRIIRFFKKTNTQA